MASRLSTTVLVAGAVAAVLVPLHGDPAAAPLTHSEWARMLLRALRLESALPISATASKAFSLLTWNESLAFDGDQYLHADGLRRDGQGVVAAGPQGGEAVFAIAVARPGDYRLRARLEGDPARPAAAALSEQGEKDVAAHLTLVPRRQPGWVDGGQVQLRAGVYTAALAMEPGTRLHRLEVDPPCLSPIEPPGGWRALAVLQRDDLAVTALQGADLEWKLPTAAPPVEVAAERFQTDPALRPAAGGGEEGLRGGPEGARGLAFVELPEEGLYTIWAEGTMGSGQRWSADECRKVVLCPAARPDEGAQWHVVMTGHFTAGRHFFGMELGAGALVRRLRAERKRDGPADYVDALRQQGFDAGPAGTVARATAVDAMAFIERQRRRLQESACGGLRFLRPEAAQIALAAPVAPPAAAPGAPGFPGPPPGVGGAPPVPPPPEASPGSPDIPPQ